LAEAAAFEQPVPYTLNKEVLTNLNVRAMDKEYDSTGAIDSSDPTELW
jgi:hypothetical protein